MREGCGFFAITPIEVALDKRLTLRQMRVLIALLSFNGDGSNVVWPKREKLAQRANMSLEDVSKATTGLVQLGWVAKEGCGGRSAPTRYRLTIPQTVADCTTVCNSETVADCTTVFNSETVAEHTTVYGETVAEHTTVYGETVAECAETVAECTTKTVASDATGKEKKEKRKKEKKGGTRAREARAAPPPPPNVGVQESGGRAGGSAAATGQPGPPGPPDVVPEAWAEWVQHRAAQGASSSARVLARAREEAAGAGMTLQAFLDAWVYSGYKNFTAEIALNMRERRKTNNGGGGAQMSFAERDRAYQRQRLIDAGLDALVEKPPQNSGEGIIDVTAAAFSFLPKQ